MQEKQIEYQFSSASLQEKFNDIKDHYLNDLRQKINNFYIEFKLTVTENNSVNHLLTKQELFAQMAAKNPYLEQLKTNLDLDIYG